ncbi:unnamed protein product [Chironomus riparius]|uniref:G-protein coupled receptors family 2 profile 2 domain-containing protein n=1 Tax=Chironomus riparius TaxID=315576 RepID=A0A9N9RVZ6_9DIPT|nr:unnamed protein product [Chironomus riparius]
MKAFLFLIVKLLCIIFVFGATKSKGYSSKYINDFNKSASPDFDYDLTKNVLSDEIKTPDETKQQQDDNLEIYPDPEIFHRRLLNKTRFGDRHDETLIKIYTTRVRQSRKERLRNNQSQDLNNEDLNGHDFIDSIMFIYYYGKSPRSWQDLGRRIVIIGACFAIGAQILTIILVTLRNRRLRKSNAFFPITMNLLIMLFLSNLLFIIGVHSNKNPLRCEMIALVLHYLYLTTSVWCFVFIAIIYDLIINEYLRLKMRFILLIAYVGPAIYVMFSYAAASNSLEYQKYCFMSIHKNMIINFLIPIFLLIVFTTILGTICLKHIKDKNRDILDSTSNGVGTIMNNGQNLDKCISDKEILASYYMKTSTFTTQQLKCCDDHAHDDNFFKSKTDLYDSKFDLGQLSLADLSDSSSTTSNSCDYTNFKNATKFSLFFQPVFAICWFIGVVALENIQSYAFPTVFAILYNILNWSILLKSRNILPFMKHFYEVEQIENAANEQEETDEDNNNQLARKDSKNMKNNKNLLNQLFLNSNTESSLVLASSNGLHRTDQIPLLYQTQFNHRKSIANLELTKADFHFEKHKINSRSEHDLLFQQQLGHMLTNGIENVIGCGPIRNSWDMNLDRVSTISN